MPTNGILSPEESRRHLLDEEERQRKNRSPAERAGQPTPDEQRALDAAHAAWEKAIVEHERAAQAVFAVRRRGAEILSRVYDHLRVDPETEAERERARAEEDAARRVMEHRLEARTKAQVRFNKLNAQIGGELARRRAAVERAENRAAYVARMRAIGQYVEEDEAEGDGVPAAARADR